jgi:hypothetical protein
MAISDKDSSVRGAAVERLTNQTALAQVVKNESTASIRKAAVANLVDQTLITDMATNDKNPSVRGAAVERLTNQAVLAHVAKNEEVASIRRAAVAKLTDQIMLAEVANARVGVLIPLLNVEKSRSGGSAWMERKAAAQELIEIAKSHPALLAQHWEYVGSLVSGAHIDTHEDGYGGSKNCDLPEARSSYHTDAGIGLNFPPFPANLTK